MLSAFVEAAHMETSGTPPICDCQAFYSSLPQEVLHPPHCSGSDAYTPVNLQLYCSLLNSNLDPIPMWTWASLPSKHLSFIPLTGFVLEVLQCLKAEGSLLWWGTCLCLQMCLSPVPGGKAVWELAHSLCLGGELAGSTGTSVLLAWCILFSPLIKYLIPEDMPQVFCFALFLAVWVKWTLQLGTEN